MVICGLCHYRKTQLSYQKHHYQYYFCPQCQTLFLHPLPSNKELSVYYKKFINSAPQQERLIRLRSKSIIGKLKKLHPKGVSLIDIGCGYGFFLDEAKKKHLTVFGIEPSMQSFNYVKNILKLNILNTDLERFLKSNRKRFDFVIYSHVIEHVKHPKKVIYQLSKLLKPSGILYIETPNLNSHLFYSEKENYTFLLPPEHLWIFSLKSFSKLIPSNLSIIQVNTISQPEHFMGILKNIFKNYLSTSTVQTTKACKQTQNLNQKPTKILKKIKYILLDEMFAPFFTPLLNKNNLGSILQIYLRKK